MPNESITLNDLATAIARGKTGYTVLAKVGTNGAQVFVTLTPNGVSLDQRNLDSDGWHRFESWDLFEVVRRYNEMG